MVVVASMSFSMCVAMSFKKPTNQASKQREYKVYAEEERIFVRSVS